MRLLLAGGEFADIRQYASTQEWKVSDRQVRRYMEAAYKKLARVTERDRTQLLGRHLMQRRALDARAIKSTDVRTALQVLRDQAALEGLYPASKAGAGAPDGITSYSLLAGTHISKRERVVRLLAAPQTTRPNCPSFAIRRPRCSTASPIPPCRR